ncbi:MAG: HD domain-containing protein [Anaerolineales bacterium]|jgi:uncharacterized protein
MPSIEAARGWYPEYDPVHGFDHALRVLHLATWLGERLAADQEILKAAALLHDASGAHPQGEEGRESHERTSANFAREVLIAEGWDQDDIQAVEHCILAHRYRGKIKPETIEAQILFDADKLDVIGAFGVSRTIGFAIQVGQPIYEEPSVQFLETGNEIPGEPHSAYHEYLFKLAKVKERLYTTPAQELASSRFKVLKQFFDQLDLEARCADVQDHLLSAD